MRGTGSSNLRTKFFEVDLLRKMEGFLRFSFLDDDKGIVVAEFNSLDNFFSGRRNWYSDNFADWTDDWPLLKFAVRDLRFIDPAMSAAFGPDGRSRTLGNMHLQVLDLAGRCIGSYWVPDITMQDWHAREPGLLDCSMVGWVGMPPDIDAPEVWDAFRVGPPAAKNNWAELPPGRREAWLEVISKYKPATPLAETRQLPRQSVTLDGRFIVDPASFFCAIGEAINGPGGYFGCNIPSLHDCLRGGFGIEGDFVLNWQNYNVAQSNLNMVLDTEGSNSFLDVILDVFGRAGKTIVFS